MIQLIFYEDHAGCSVEGRRWQLIKEQKDGDKLECFCSLNKNHVDLGWSSGMGIKQRGIESSDRSGVRADLV